MTLTGGELTSLFLGQLIFGAVLITAVSVALKRELLTLFDAERGQLFLQIITIFFVCTITGNLTLMKILDAGAASAIFGGVLGYVFGRSGGRPQQSSRIKPPLQPTVQKEPPGDDPA